MSEGMRGDDHADGVLGDLSFGRQEPKEVLFENMAGLEDIARKHKPKEHKPAMPRPLGASQYLRPIASDNCHPMVAPAPKRQPLLFSVINGIKTAARWFPNQRKHKTFLYTWLKVIGSVILVIAALVLVITAIGAFGTYVWPLIPSWVVALAAFLSLTAFLAAGIRDDSDD